jgi:hypothetical protein
MNCHLKSIFIALIFTGFSGTLLAISHNHPDIVVIDDLVEFHMQDYKKIKKLYDRDIRKEALFTEDQLYNINHHNLTPIIDELLGHPKLKIPSIELLVDFALDIKISGFNLEELENRLYANLEKGLPLFSALSKAIEKTGDSQWRELQKRSLDPQEQLVIEINALKLKADEYKKVLDIYAVCIKPWKNQEYRSTRLQPKICAPSDDYAAPRHDGQHVTIRTKASTKRNDRVTAYHQLAQEGALVADDLNLSVAERVMMAKCVAEQSLTFFTPSHSPLKALKKIRHAQTHSPEHAFFGHEGVCTNFSGLSYNFSRELSLENHVFLARKGMHTFLEIEIDGEWFHSHPFNGTNKGCDLIRFKG